MLSFLRNPIFPSDTVSNVKEEYYKDMKIIVWKIAKCQGKISETSGNFTYYYDKQEIATSFRGPI